MLRKAGNLLGAALAGLAFASSAGAEEQVCHPAATVSGEEADVVTSILAHLQARGVDTAPEPGCPKVVVMAARAAGSAIEVKATSPAGQQETRTVTDPATAATWVETWVRRDLVDGLLAGEIIPDATPRVRPAPLRIVAPARSAGADRLPEVRVAGAVARDGGRSADASARAPTPVADEAPPIGFGVEPGLSVASDGSLWADLTLRGCGRVGPLCIGGDVRGLFDMEVTGSQRDLETTRGGLDVLVSATWSFPLGPVFLRPVAAVGGGWFRRAMVEDDIDADVQIDEPGVRVAAGVELGVPFTEDAQVVFALSTRFSPLAESRTVHEQGLELAGEPSVMGRLGVGLRMGAP